MIIVLIFQLIIELTDCNHDRPRMIRIFISIALKICIDKMLLYVENSIAYNTLYAADVNFYLFIDITLEKYFSKDSALISLTNFVDM